MVALFVVVAFLAGVWVGQFGYALFVSKKLMDIATKEPMAKILRESILEKSPGKAQFFNPVSDREKFDKAEQITDLTDE